MLTGGQEKKIRLFDLNRPDAEPFYIGGDKGETVHDGVIKSVLWVGDWGGVSGGDDGLIKSAVYSQGRYKNIDHCFQVVGPPSERANTFA